MSSSWFPHFYAPRKRAATIHSVYIADGLADDCEELINRCCQAGPLNFNVFSNIWKDMNFAWIFQCRSSGAELAEFSEEALLVARRYLIQDTTNFEETIASLFLVYALLNMQPLKGFAALRLVPEDLEAIFRIEDTARQQKRHDVLYILASVLVKGPCQFHAAEREYGMDTGSRKYFDTVTSIDKYGTRPKGVFYRQTEELDLLRELSSLGRRYARAKKFDDKGMPDKTLRYTDEHLPNELAASLKQLIDGETGNKSHAVVQSIKERAMWNTIQEMRHLKRLPESRKRIGGKKVRRRDSTSSSPVKSTSKASPSNNGSPNKRSNSSKKKAVIKPTSKSVVSSTSDDDSDISLSSTVDETDEDLLGANYDTDNDETDISLSNIKCIEDYINRMKSCPQSVLSDNSQPSTSNSNLQYEIEIIDYMNDNNDAVMQETDNKTNAEMKDTVNKTNKKIKDTVNKTNKEMQVADNKPNKAAIKAIGNINKKVKLNTNKSIKNAKEKLKSDETEAFEVFESKIIKPIRKSVIKKTPDFGSLRGSKSRLRSIRCETATASVDTPQSQEALSLPELAVFDDEFDNVKGNRTAKDAVKLLGLRRSSRRLSQRSNCDPNA